MKRVMIIGCCGSGKSTLSRNLKDKLGLPMFHLDQYYWKENWTETPKEEWTEIVKELAEKESWIIDGNYGGTMDFRMERADTIIYLDYSTIRCLWRVTKRVIKYHGKVRLDMPAGCKERFDWDFFHYVATYNLIRGKSIRRKIEHYQNTKTVIILKSDKEVNQFLYRSDLKTYC